MDTGQLAQLKSLCETDKQYTLVLTKELSDLIAEVERQARYIEDLKHDMDATVRFCDEHHR